MTLDEDIYETVRACVCACLCVCNILGKSENSQRIGLGQ